MTGTDASECAVVIFQKAYSAVDLDMARQCRDTGVATIFDLCDNHFDNPEDRPEFRDRTDRLDRMMEVVDLVTTSTPELARVISRPNCRVIDDALDNWPVGWGGWVGGLASQVRFRFAGTGRTRLLWFGNVGVEYPQFGMIDLAERIPMLAELSRRYPIELTVVSNSREAFDKYFRAVPFPVRYLNWKLWLVPAIAKAHHVCLIPVQRNPFTVCKTSNRLVHALMLGLPVIADSIPSYLEFAPYVTLDDWVGGLTRVVTDRGAAAAQVEAGQAYIRKRFDRDSWLLQWRSALEAAIQARARRTAV
jgi:hypothetical protein